MAPLGTALTEDQLRILWKQAAEPILCFDGDGAGIKAAYRALDLALPLLEPGHSLRFALLPEVPTIDARYPAFDSAIVWAGLVAPKGLPPDVRARIKSAVDAALSSEKYLQAARNFGLEPLKPWSSDDLSKFITGQRARWGDVIKRANIHI